MTKSKTRAPPSQYPPFAFHAIRTCLLISSLVVSAILSFFVYHLNNDNFKIPWTFLVLFGVALLSLVTWSLTLAIHLCHSLSPLFSLIINVPLLLLWIIGLSLLGWNMSGTLGHACNSANWASAAGIMVCRMYKTLFAFALLAAMSATATLVLDLRIRRRQISLGKYDQMRDSTYDLKPSENAFSAGALGRHHDDHPVRWQREGHELNDYNTRNSSREPIRSQHFGYTSPSEQTRYDAGNYGGRDRG